jgi:hypothetical protein
MIARPMTRGGIFRWLCGRRGAALARGAILVLSVIGPTIGGAVLWIGIELWNDYSDQKKILGTVASDLRAYMGASQERGNAARARLDKLETQYSDVDRRLDGHEGGIARIEGQIN